MKTIYLCVSDLLTQRKIDVSTNVKKDKNNSSDQVQVCIVVDCTAEYIVLNYKMLIKQALIKIKYSKKGISNFLRKGWITDDIRRTLIAHCSN